MDVLLLRAYASGMCLPIRCLATGVCVTSYVPLLNKQCKLPVYVYTYCISVYVRVNPFRLLEQVTDHEVLCDLYVI
jgi:hypothetical protein